LRQVNDDAQAMKGGKPPGGRFISGGPSFPRNINRWQQELPDGKERCRDDRQNNAAYPVGWPGRRGSQQQTNAWSEMLAPRRAVMPGTGKPAVSSATPSRTSCSTVWSPR